MALFQKRTDVSHIANLYTTGLQKTLLITGLGNPGKEYDNTRHNLGFVCIDEFAVKNNFSAWVHKKDMKCLFSMLNINKHRIILVKPTTFMNLSGDAVQLVTNFYNIPPNNLLVLHDDIDINFGTIKIQSGGSSAGHNGIQSIIDSIGYEFGRIRIGIGPKKPETMDSADFVLARISKNEMSNLSKLNREVSALISEYIFNDGNITNESRTFLI